MGITFDPVSGQWSFNWVPVLEKLFRFAESRWGHPKEREFAVVRNLLMEHRHAFSALALAYYRQRSLSTDFPLVVHEDWIPGAPVDLGKVQISWDKTTAPPPAVSLDSFPMKELSYAENVKHMFPETRLEDRFAYRLTSVSKTNRALHLTFGPSTYFEFFNTCESLSYELCRAAVKEYQEKNASSLKEIDLSRISLPKRERISLFELRNRAAVPGINTLFILLNKHGKGQHVYYLHLRSSKKVAEAMNTFHVVPAGTFQPEHFHDDFHARDFSLMRNILREFAEELLGKEELSEMAKQDQDFMADEALRPYLSPIAKEARMVFMGIGLDPLNTKPEILTSIILNWASVGKGRSEWRFKDSFEGEHIAAPFTAEGVDKYLQDERTLPAARACLVLAKRHYSALTRA